MNNTIQKRIELFREKFACNEKDHDCNGNLIHNTHTVLVEQFLIESMEQAQRELMKYLRAEHPNSCLCYKYQSNDGVWHLIQCDKCGRKELKPNE